MVCPKCKSSDLISIIYKNGCIGDPNLLEKHERGELISFLKKSLDSESFVLVPRK